MILQPAVRVRTNSEDEKEYAVDALQRISSSEDALNMGKAEAAEHGLCAAHRVRGLGRAGIARDRDRVSIDHFLSELDKAFRRERQVHRGGNTCV